MDAFAVFHVAGLHLYEVVIVSRHQIAVHVIGTFFDFFPECSEGVLVLAIQSDMYELRKPSATWSIYRLSVASVYRSSLLTRP